METFTASRLTEGNRVFPSKIILDEQGVTLKNPSLFSGREKTVPFNRISSVKIETPMIGFSTIIIETTGEGRIASHGFSKDDVKRMKEIILARIV